MSFSLTRRQFYDLIWQEPMRTLREHFAVSDVTLGKTARKANVPLPGVGYWAKVQAGAAAEQQMLPDRDLGTPDTIEFKAELTNELKRRIVGEPGIVTEPEEDIAVLGERLRARLHGAGVPKTFSGAYSAIRSALAHDERTRIRRTRGESWQVPRFEDDSGRRILRVANGLFLAAESVGGGGSVRVADGVGFYIELAGFSLPLKITAAIHKRGDMVSTEVTVAAEHMDRLTGYRQLWSDTATWRIEDHIADVVVDMATLVEVWRRNWAKERRESERRATEEKERERERIAAEATQRRIDDLEGEAKAYRRATLIREYVAAVQRVKAHEDPAVSRWVAWALATADAIDPVVNGNAMRLPKE